MVVNNGKVSAADTVSNLHDSGALNSLLEGSDRQIILEDSIENIGQSDSNTHNPDSSISSEVTLVENESQDVKTQKKNAQPKVLVEEEGFIPFFLFNTSIAFLFIYHF